jgi:hypothetical protein
MHRSAQTITRALDARSKRTQGLVAIKATLQKAAIHRDRRDRRRTHYSPVIRPKFRITIRLFEVTPGHAPPGQGFVDRTCLAMAG